MRDLFSRAAVTAGAGVVLALGVLAPVAAQAAAPKTLFVSQGGFNSGTCPSASPCATVSYALTKAASGATIKVSGTIDDHVSISNPVTITTWPGGPAGSPGVLDGTDALDASVVTVNGVTGVTLHDLTIENGLGPGAGGGISNNNGTVTLTDSTVSGNEYGGINNDGGTMTVIDSTVANNSDPGNGGAAGIAAGGTMTVIGSTISGNTGDGGNTGGIYSIGTVTLGATIVAGNNGGNCDAAGGAASLQSAGYNLTSDKTGKACGFTAATDRVNKNPLLGHLAKNGGPTKTLLPAAGSPAADVIPTGTTLHGVKVCPGTDQRGVARPGKGETRCTIGAVEVASAAGSRSAAMLPGSSSSAVAAAKFSGCMVANIQGIHKAFNKVSWQGMQAAAAAEPSKIQVTYLQSTSDAQYAVNISVFIARKCGLIVTVGPDPTMASVTETFAKDNPRVKFAIVDCSYASGCLASPKLKNLVSVKGTASAVKTLVLARANGT